MDKMFKSNSIRDKLRTREYLERNDMFKTALKERVSTLETMSKLKNDLQSTGRGLYPVRNTYSACRSSMNNLFSANQRNQMDELFRNTEEAALTTNRKSNITKNWNIETMQDIRNNFL